MTNFFLLLNSYALYLLGSSIILNFTLLWILVNKKKALELEKIRIKIATLLEFEFKTNPDERNLLLKREIEDLKHQVAEYKKEMKSFFLLLLFALLIYMFVSYWNKILSFFKYSEKKNEKTNKNESNIEDKILAISEENNPDLLLHELELMEKAIDTNNRNNNF